MHFGFFKGFFVGDSSFQREEQGRKQQQVGNHRKEQGYRNQASQGFGASKTRNDKNQKSKKQDDRSVEHADAKYQKPRRT